MTKSSPMRAPDKVFDVVAKKACYVGVDGKARKVKKIYTGVDNKARKVKKAYVGVGGKARPFFSAEQALSYYGTVSPLSQAKNNLAATTMGYLVGVITAISLLQ